MKHDQGIVIKDGVECPTEYTRMDDTWSKLQIYHYVIRHRSRDPRDIEQ